MKMKVSSYIAARCGRTPKDFIVTHIRGSGPGGQHRNKVSTGVRIVDKATGLASEATNSRSQEDNKREAFTKLAMKIIDYYHQEEMNQKIVDIQASGEGRYRRTYKEKEGIAVDHLTKKSYDLGETLDGNLDQIFQDV